MLLGGGNALGQALIRLGAEEDIGFLAPRPPQDGWDAASLTQLLDDTRRHLAEAHLKEGRLDLAEIALLLGYSEQSAFTRAFRAWTGQPPAQWRRAQLRGASLPGASVHTPAP